MTLGMESFFCASCHKVSCYDDNVLCLIFVFTERGAGVVRTRPKKRLNPDELMAFNNSTSKETQLRDVLKNSFFHDLQVFNLCLT